MGARGGTQRRDRRGGRRRHPPNRKVRNRRYHGLCITQEQGFQEALKHFRDRRAAIYALYEDQPLLRPTALAESISYLDEFFEVIEDPVRVERQLLRRCNER